MGRKTETPMTPPKIPGVFPRPEREDRPKPAEKPKK
jgi:hypothetical protein